MGNCSSRSANIETGIHATTVDGLLILRIGSGRNIAHVPILRSEGLEICGVRILSARAILRHGRKFISARRDWRGALLYVDVPGLDFSKDESTEIPISNAWPGAETLGEIFVQWGRRNDVEQYQLVAIEHSESVFLADRSRRYVKASCCDGVLIWERPTIDEFALYLAARATSKLFDHRSLLWTQKTLEAIGKSMYWSDTLAGRLRSLEAIR